MLTIGTGTRGAVLIARPLTEVEHELSRLVLILALIGGGGVMLAALLGALVARTALAPIARRAPGSAWRSYARPPRHPAATPRPRTPPAGARC